jgi:hypothetical protein
MQQFEHLQGLVINDQQEKKRTNRQEEIKKLTGLTLRLYRNGEVYPSEELVKLGNLEYQPKDAEDMGNGLDIVDSTDWTPVANLPRTILISFTGRSNPKVDLFATTKYNELAPKSSVLTQGIESEMLLTIARSMGWFGSGEREPKYVDLQVLTQYSVKTNDGIAYIPKIVARGERKGDKTYERRENQVFYPITPIIQVVDTTTNTTVETTAEKVSVTN